MTGRTGIIPREFALAPAEQGESVGAHVARILDVLARSGLPYQLLPMGMILEDEWTSCTGSA